ncbi:MAG: RecX family transcriptional regulator [Armatimonadetes bacterium]|nr:RecX family transcriptional regulator [Armatimonadota bacterium]MDE2207604.1 RecX family transcriptional regulator [Armatimonadota bacterium]
MRTGDRPPEQALPAAERSLKRVPCTATTLRQRLLRMGFDAATADAAVSSLRDRGLLNDEAFARAWVADRAPRKGYGRQRLEQELRTRGIPRELIATALSAYSPEEELDQAMAAAERRWAQMIAGKPEIDLVGARRKLTGWMQRRGFPPSVIAQVIRGVARNSSYE